MSILHIALTGGPGGGKSTLIEELLRDPAWRGRFAALPEAISLMRSTGVSPREKLFQRVMVSLQMALEDGLAHGLDAETPHVILCHRGWSASALEALDVPAARWRAAGLP